MKQTVLSYQQARKAGWVPGEFGYRPGEVPIGRMTARLYWKVWARMVMGIGCYFEEIHSGRKFVITVYYNAEWNGYRTDKNGYDLAGCPVGVAYAICVVENSRGKPYLKMLDGPICEDVRQSGGDTA